MRRGDDLTTFMCRVSRNLGALTSWPRRPVKGILYVFLPIKPNGRKRNVKHKTGTVIGRTIMKIMKLKEKNLKQYICSPTGYNFVTAGRVQ